MAPPFAMYTAKLSEKRQHNEMFFQLRLELVSPNRLEFQAGQYVILNVPGHAKKKSYSICSAPSTTHAIELLIDTAPGGPGSIYARNIQPGEEVTFMAPFGRFIVAPQNTEIGQAEKKLMFIATGSGIAPMLGMLKDLLIDKGDKRPMTLYWGLRYAEDQLWFEEFDLLAREHPNFTFHPTLSRPPEDWPLCRGRVTDCLTVHPQSPADTGYYLCGSTPMINDVSAVLLKLGAKSEHIHHEKFI